MLRALLFLLAVASCSGAKPVMAQTPPRTIETLRGDLATQADQLLTAAGVDGFNGAVIIEIEGEIALAAGYGWADREQGMRFTIDTIAQIGSITKPFTGAAIADLERQGLVDLDEPVRRYLPRAAEPVASVTLRQLLSHRSLLRDYCGDDFDRRTREEVLSVCAAMPLEQTLDASAQAYSNSGYSVLAAIVEEVSGQPIETYISDRLLAPVGIREDGHARDARARARLAAGYENGARIAPISERLAAMNGDY